MGFSIMSNGEDRTEPTIKADQVYQTLVSLVEHSEQVRWTRLNTFLVVASIFLAAWAGIFAGTNNFEFKSWLLFALCCPGFVLGVMWACLGWRSSQYMDDFHDTAHKMEATFNGQLPKPFHVSESRRKGLKKGISRYTSSKWLVMAVPALFTLLFVALGIASFELNKESVVKNQSEVTGVVLKEEKVPQPNQTIKGTPDILGANISHLDILLPSIATLAAAFFGAWFAYKLENNQKKREEQKNNINKANDLLFALFTRLNEIKLFQIDFIDPCRGDRGKLISMLPAIDYKLPETPFQPENLNFFMKTKYKQLWLDAHIEDRRFHVAEKAIRYRSDLHLKQVQPTLSAAGMKHGEQYTDAEYKKALGNLLYTQLENATEAVVNSVDKVVKSSDELRGKLISALKDIFPEAPILQFELLEKTPNKTLQ